VANAVLYTTVANVAAIPGSPANNAAVEVTNSTGIQSFTPLSGLPAGFIGSSGLSVRIIYQTSGATWTWIQYFPNDPETRYLKLAGGTLTGAIENLTVNTGDASIYGVRVGRGLGAISTNTALGNNALNTNTTGSNNTGVGQSALYSNTTGYSNTAVGVSALYANTTGYSNVAYGVNALSVNTVGVQNTANGYASLYLNISGNNNTAHGFQALYSNTTGGTNTCYGYNAGNALTTGSNNTIIGSIAGTAGLSDTVIIGAGATERLRIDSSGRVGVGTSSVSALVHAKGAGGSTSGSELLRLETTQATGGNWISFYDASARKGYIGYKETTDDNLYIANEESGHVVIPGTTRLGIGTSVPGGVLDIRDSGTTIPALGAKGTGLNVLRTDGAIGLIIGYQGASGGSYIQAQHTNAGGSAYPLLLQPNGGNVGIGTTPGEVLDVNPGSSGGVIRIQNTANTNTAKFRATNTASSIDLGTDGSGGFIEQTGAYPLRFYVNGPEAARFDSSRRLLVGTSSVLGSGQVGFLTSGANQVLTMHNSHATPFGLVVKYTTATPNSTGAQFVYLEDASALRCEIRSNGGIANYSANNVNLSDVNTKKDISPVDDTWDCLKEWEIVSFRYKDQPDDADLNLGVIAQQVAESCPEVITVFEEAKDDQPEKLGVKEQQMYWMAIKALQEAQARIEALEADVAQLKGA
jgi:hypothetical protein